MKDKHKIRALILQEWRARRTIKQAHENICRELGENAVSYSAVRNWYGKFKAGNTNIRDKNDKDYDQPVENADRFCLSSNKAILFKTDDWDLCEGLATIDGRFAFAVGTHTRMFPFSCVAFGLFHGTKIRLLDSTVPCLARQGLFQCITVVDDEHLLCIATAYDNSAAFLIHFDNNAWTFKVVARKFVPLARVYRIILDQAGRDHILLQDRSTNSYWRGQIVDNVLNGDETPMELVTDLYCHKLRGNRVYALKRQDVDGASKTLFCEYNLESRSVEKLVDVPMVLDTNEAINWGVLNVLNYTWRNSTLFLYSNPSKDNPTIYRLETESLVWSKLNINVTGIIKSIFVCENGFLTVSAYERMGKNQHEWSDKPCENAVYRFALKSPDSLVNLAWLAVRYQHNFRGTQLYERLRERLPYNTHLRCLFPDA